MRIQHCDHLVADANDDITKAVRRLLRDGGVLGPPTPLADLLALRHLHCEPQSHHALLATASIHLRAAAKNFWSRLKHKIAGVLDLKARHVLVNPHLHPRRQKFVAYHELGHDVLPWHYATFVVTSEADLNPNVRKIFEAEANDFAAKAIFQLDHLANVQRGIRLEMGSLAGIAAQYGASLISTARHYVCVQDIPVALLVGRPQGTLGQRGIRFSYGVANAAFLREFAAEVMGDGLSPDSPCCAILNVDGLDVMETEVPMVDLRGDGRTMVLDTMYTGYNTLTLVHPRATVRPHHDHGNVRRNIIGSFLRGGRG
ncbi:MAG: ImmA/IrrE family metallo-endopeptidase [Gemmatimonadota bacterium]|nr:ImmA/IrrE family metallo-endopeptidase [Gemmatimonadota bacterium]